MKKTKVCHIITMLEMGGAQNNTLYTVEHLDRSKFDVLLISGSGGILDNRAKQIPHARVYFAKYLIRKINPVYDILSLIELYQILLEEKPDIVHTHSSKAGILGRWSAFFAGVPTILHTFHGFGFNDYQKKFVKFIFIFVERVTAGITKILIGVSKENISTGIKNKIGNSKKYVLIRSGIKLANFKSVYKFDHNEECSCRDCSAIKIANQGWQLQNERLKKELNLSNNHKIVITIGPFKPQKNLMDFVRLANLVSQKNSSVKFLVIGDGEQRESLELEIRKLKLQDKIILVGWRKDIPRILSITDIFVLTSLWEGLPRSVVEAMACARPVVCYAVDGNKEIVKDSQTGFLVEPGNFPKLSEKVIELLENDKMRTEMGLKAKESIGKEFDIDYMVTQQENLYCDFCHSL